MMNLKMYHPAILEVVAEQKAQLKKWGKQEHPDYTEYGLLPPSISVLVSPTADAAKRICDSKVRNSNLSWNDIFVEECLEACEEAKSGNVEALRKELIQVAAVCCSWIDHIDEVNNFNHSEFIGGSL